MSRFDEEVEQRFAEIRAEDRIEAEREKLATEEAQQAVEALAEEIDKRIASRRLVLTVIPADEVFDAFAKFVIEVRHRRSNIVLGHVLQRDFSAPPRYADEYDPGAVAPDALDRETPAPPRVALFFEPTILYEHMELQGYACDLVEEIDPIQFDRAAFIEWLYADLVELTAAHEQPTRN
jgi:hypothetical protein